MEALPHRSMVILNLVNPKEKFWGVLESLSPVGVTLRGINLDSFDDWVHQVAKDEDATLDLVTMFVPLFRVERIFLDEPVGAVKSYAQVFEETVGVSLHEFLGFKTPEN